MGIFSGSSLEADEALEMKMNKNPYYPFTKVGDEEFVYETRFYRLFVFIAVAIASVLLIALFTVLGLVSEFYFIIPIFSFVASVAAAYAYKDVRKYHLDGITKRYYFYLGNRLIFEGGYHNVYIRLRFKQTSSGRRAFFVVFNGYQIERFIITGFSKREAALRKLAQQLAENLGINYFDTSNTSHFHVVRHERPPY